MKKIIVTILVFIVWHSAAFDIIVPGSNDDSNAVPYISYTKRNVDIGNTGCANRIAGDLARYISILIHSNNSDKINNIMKNIKLMLKNNKNSLVEHLVNHGHMGYIPTLYAPLDVCFSQIKDIFIILSKGSRLI